jgi:hypothetical protein
MEPSPGGTTETLAGLTEEVAPERSFDGLRQLRSHKIIAWVQVILTWLVNDTNLPKSASRLVLDYLVNFPQLQRRGVALVSDAYDELHFLFHIDISFAIKIKKQTARYL